MVIGRDLLSALGIIVNFRDGIVEWNGNTVTVNTGVKRKNSEVISGVEEPRTDPTQDEEIVDEVKEINDTSMKPTELIVDTSITDETYKEVVKVLTCFETLYNGHLGRIKLPYYTLPISDSATPIHTRPYSIPRSEEVAARKELQRRIKLDVIEQIFDGEWTSPAFFMKKPDGRLRLLTDFRWLNMFMLRSPYYVPLIREVLMRLCGAAYFSSLDANMGYYARQLAGVSRRYTAFCTPFRKFQYKRLPMGVSTAPDEYQACMAKILGNFEMVIVYLDDILIFSKTAENHLKHLRVEVVLRNRKIAGALLHTAPELPANGGGTPIFREEVDYLGFTLSAEGIQPQEKKIRAITQLTAPKNKNYFEDFWEWQVSTPQATYASPKVTFVWTSVENEAFEGVKNALANAVLLSFPDFTKPFDIYIDASGKQLGGLIQQKGKLIACYSRRITTAQQNYTTLDLELLSVVEIIKEYLTMLLGFPIIVRTDHKNLIFSRETSLRIKRWKLLVSEYRLTCRYVPGKSNVGADAFSRIEYDREPDNLAAEVETMYIDPVDCVVEERHIKQHQRDDEATESLVQACMNGTCDPDYRIENMMGARLLTFKKRVLIPEALREEITEWYHLSLVHPAAKRHLIR
ncbi:Retrovirus Polyprotein [Phytophthora palmivora]|uniref:Retrovirus Polyprotein n=1 Tax=Phytophthora palmivora TaxID=4796 RepID=A0A2P4Y923_9STRA|nr:Retrovirus Polyprotein [Phytophthora palmivora]